MMPQVHGHRGCGGTFPPNTVPAFVQATALGCHWLEMDVVITGDRLVLVSHEPWMAFQDCAGPDGKALTEAEGRALNIFKMTLPEVQRYQVMAQSGGATAPKPTLAEVVQAVDLFAKDHDMAAPRFNIEVKSGPELYGTYQPGPAAFTALITAEIDRSGLAQRCLIQSFDPAILKEAHHLVPSIPLALLVENTDGLAANLARLDFTPAYYSPCHELIDDALVNDLRAKCIGLLAWTVNEEADMRRMLNLGVDGLITDRPAAALALLAEVQ